MEQDTFYMRQAMELAEKGRGATNPNPVVGAVIVKEGRVIGSGYHAKYGELHAERNALSDCQRRGEDAKGATIYVTLEPCCHYGKTPPCTEAILEAGISRVVVGARDSNPKVAGGGITLLRQHGVEVAEGVLEEECRRQNRIFFHYMEQKMPYVILKYAMTLDGKIATTSGKSKWITCEEARKHVHNLRRECMGIMVGVGTVLEDDPMLNCRLPASKDPIRIICDTNLSTPLGSQVVKTAKEQQTILATCTGDEKKQQKYRDRGCEVLVVPKKDGKVDLRVLMKCLAEKGIDSILLEGGGTLNDSALQSGIVKEIHAYVAPKLFGGATAKTPVMGDGVMTPDEAYLLQNVRVEPVGTDYVWIGELCERRQTCLPEL